MDEEDAKGTGRYDIDQFSIGYIDVHKHHEGCNADSNRQGPVTVAYETPWSVTRADKCQCDDRANS